MSKRVLLGAFCVVVVGLIVVASFLLLGKGAEPSVRDLRPKVDSAEAQTPKSDSTEQSAPRPSAHSSTAARPPKNELHVQAPLAGLVISPSVKTIIGLEKEQRSYKDRRAALLQLTRRLSKDDVTALRAFLSAKGVEKGISPLEFNAVKNDVLDVLLRQDVVPEALGAQLAEMYRDKAHDDIWRDYCIQYLGTYYDIRWPAGAKAETDPERKDVEAAYWEALAETDKTFAGTALLGIERLSRARPEIGSTNVADVAVSLATNEGCIEANRITAFRVAALMNRKDVLPSARVTAQTGATGPLRMAAIATIGDLGDAADREFLQSFAAGSEKRVTVIAAAALKRLDARLAAAAGQS